MHPEAADSGYWKENSLGPDTAQGGSAGGQSSCRLSLESGEARLKVRDHRGTAVVRAEPVTGVALANRNSGFQYLWHLGCIFVL